VGFEKIWKVGVGVGVGHFISDSATMLEMRGVTCRIKKNANYHSILLSSQNGQSRSVVVQRSETN